MSSFPYYNTNVTVGMTEDARSGVQIQVLAALLIHVRPTCEASLGNLCMVPAKYRCSGRDGKLGIHFMLNQGARIEHEVARQDKEIYILL